MFHSHFFEFEAKPVLIGHDIGIKGVLCLHAGMSAKEVHEYINQQAGLGNPGPYTLGKELSRAELENMKDIHGRTIEEASNNYSGAKFFGFITERTDP